MFTVIIIIIVVVVILIIIIIITSTIIIITIIITVIIIMTISNRYYYYCYFLSFIIIFYNNFRYSCHHTDMTSYQISTLNFLCISVDSHMLSPPPSLKKRFICGTTKEMKPHTFFVLFLPSQLAYFFIFYFTLQFSFWLYIYLKKLRKFFVYWIHFCSGERYLLTCLLTYWMKSWVKKLQISSTFPILRKKFAKVDKAYRWFWSLVKVLDLYHEWELDQRNY